MIENTYEPYLSKKEMSEKDTPACMNEVLDFLRVRTPATWLSQAIDNIDILLIDHAHCEKKAASTALQLMYRYVDNIDLLEKMAQLAREEILHFEQVLRFIQDKGIKYDHLSASLYAQRLRTHVRQEEPGKLIDILIVGAIIEARSCERFASLAELFDARQVYPELSKYYRFLLKSESRHFLDYLTLAQEAAGEDIKERIDFFLDLEVTAIHADDKVFRFHSGALPE